MRVSRSLTIKQMATVSGVAAVTLCIFIVIQLFHFVQQRRMEYAQQMENIAHTIRQPLSQAVFKADIVQAEQILNSLKPAGVLARAEVILPNGMRVLHSDFTPPRAVPVFIAKIFELPVTITVPLYSLASTNPKPLAQLALQADSWRVYQFILSALSTMVTTYLLLALILSVAISWCINKLIIRPLRAIADELQALPPQAVIAHRLSLPARHRDDELGRLIRSYNRNQQVVEAVHDEMSRLTTRFALTHQPDKALFLTLLERGRAHPRLTQEHNILQGLEEGQFSLFLQPQVDMRNGNLVGAEALLRMRQPDGNWALPEDLMVNAEEHDVIGALGRWIVEESCRMLATWQKVGISVPLSVNFSAVQLCEPEMIMHLRELIASHQIFPGSLILEITGTAQVGEPGLALRLLGELQQVGVLVALDDFGMGHANLNWLSQLQSLPVSTLKMDRRFVCLLPGDDTMVKVIVAIAEIIKLDVIAEGVETVEQRDWLLARGIHIGQGYFYSEALPVSVFNDKYFTRLPPV
ncbi:EAL domain-containing protein [Erwinia endophytica]|uniref:EAL domain-containing protein n=1 Tax=Erwinia endophytica TaxID=1563158 RepID=UPI0019569F21|nr:EAL domain-containing protein [Erwinia endophytica]